MKKREEEATSGQLDGYGNDFFGLLLKAYHDPDNSKKISVDDLIDESKTIFMLLDRKQQQACSLGLFFF